jgi:hypothetical protein
MENLLRYRPFTKYLLVGKINGLASQSKQARRIINSAKEDKTIWYQAYREYVVGIDTRHHLLAYAFLRGTPYAALEPRCRPDNQPQAKKILQVIEAHMPPAVLNQKSVEQWLQGEQVQEVWEQIKFPKSPTKSFWNKLSQLFN